MFNAAKDLFTGKAARTYANNFIARYGRIEDLNVDSRNRKLHVVAVLDGEVDAVTLDVDSYEIHSEGAKRFVEITSCRCSRRWVQTLLNDKVVGRRFELPPWAAAAL